MIGETVETPTVKFDKIEKVLKKFLEPEFKVKNDVYLNLFVTHLVGKKNGDKCSLINTHKDQLSQWLIRASHLWNKQQSTPPNAIMSFTINLASQVSVEEAIFIKLNSENVFVTLLGIGEMSLKEDANIILGMVTLMCSFLDHESGLQWVLATSHWKGLINLGREAHTMYIRKKAYQFAAKLLEKTIIFNKNFCVNLVKLLVKPLQEAYEDLSSCVTDRPTLINNSSLFESLKPNLFFISEVLEILVNNLQGCVLNLFIDLQTAEITKKLSLVSRIEDLSYELMKIRTVLLFTDVCGEGVRKETQDDNTAATFDFQAVFLVIEDGMHKNHVRCVIKICHFAQTLYCNLADKMPLGFRQGVPIEFQSEMLLFQLIPILVFLSEKRNTRLEVMLHDVFRGEFYQKILKMSASQTVEYCFKWKPMLLEKSNLIEDLTFGLQYMMKTIKTLSKERATIFFQPLIYCLQDVLHITNTNRQQGIDREPSRYSKFTQTLMETIMDLMESFDLTWKDGIETVSVLNIASEFLQYNHWEQKMVVTALRLLNLSISKYSSPEVVLLMVNPENSVLGKTGGLLYAKCHDSSWEVRDTALENVLTLSANAISRFPSYTNILIDAEFHRLVLQMALNDGEYYVRASAFRCLQEMIQIQDLWDKFICLGEFLENILNAIEDETEGVVRKEAVTLIRKIHTHRSFSEVLLPRLYDVMTHAAVGDLHWEVKCNAVDFWFSVLEQYLTEQGLIDYSVLNFTVSTEKEKIMNLAESEVRNRLITVLNRLSKIGCLYVLKCACLDDCDLEVSRQACDNVRKLVWLIKMYNVPRDNIDEAPSPEAISTEADSITLSEPTKDFQDISDSKEADSAFDPAKADAIIDDLLNSNDMAFLRRIYNPSDQMANSQIQMKRSTYLSPAEFCKFIYDEVEKHSIDKTRWLHRLHEFDSLLDDILREYNVMDVNSMDCY